MLDYLRSIYYRIVYRHAYRNVDELLVHLADLADALDEYCEDKAEEGDVFNLMAEAAYEESDRAATVMHALLGVTE